LGSGESQNVSEKIRCDDRSGNARNVFFREARQSVAWRHFKEEVTAQSLRDYCGIMPANSMGDVVRQIRCYCRRGAHRSCIHIRDALWSAEIVLTALIGFLPALAARKTSDRSRTIDALNQMLVRYLEPVLKPPKR
jgi:hypothetical protein